MQCTLKAERLHNETIGQSRTVETLAKVVEFSSYLSELRASTSFGIFDPQKDPVVSKLMELVRLYPHQLLEVCSQIGCVFGSITIRSIVVQQLCAESTVDAAIKELKTLRDLHPDFQITAESVRSLICQSSQMINAYYPLTLVIASHQDRSVQLEAVVKMSQQGLLNIDLAEVVVAYLHDIDPGSMGRQEATHIRYLCSQFNEVASHCDVQLASLVYRRGEGSNLPGLNGLTRIGVSRS